MSQPPTPPLSPSEATTSAETLQHLSFPSYAEASTSSKSATPPPRQLLRERLYIGNLHPTVDEYSLIQVFSKFGKIAKMDYLFHKTGPLKGKPRGYAFVEYGNPADATRAQEKAHDKLLRGRKLVVTFAHQAPLDQGSFDIRRKRVTDETSKPTALSMLKTGGGSHRSDGTANKIAMMEAKLAQMSKSSPSTPAPSGPLHHPSLPAKPPPITSITADQLASSSKPRLPSKPTPLVSVSKQQPSAVLGIQTHAASKPMGTSKKLVGVKITKAAKGPSTEDTE